jgi:hypothetical protein
MLKKILASMISPHGQNVFAVRQEIAYGKSTPRLLGCEITELASAQLFPIKAKDIIAIRGDIDKCLLIAIRQLERISKTRVPVFIGTAFRAPYPTSIA